MFSSFQAFERERGEREGERGRERERKGGREGEREIVCERQEGWGMYLEF